MGNPWRERIASKAMPKRQPAQAKGKAKAKAKATAMNGGAMNASDDSAAAKQDELFPYQMGEELGKSELEQVPEDHEADLQDPQDMDDAVDDPYHLGMFQGWDESWSMHWSRGACCALLRSSFDMASASLSVTSLGVDHPSTYQYITGTIGHRSHNNRSTDTYSPNAGESHVLILPFVATVQRIPKRGTTMAQIAVG
eukprot:3620286-Amphidinium_carterae.2